MILDLALAYHPYPRSPLALDCSRSVQHIARPDARPPYGTLRARPACIRGDSAVGGGLTAQAGEAIVPYICS